MYPGRSIFTFWMQGIYLCHLRSHRIRDINKLVLQLKFLCQMPPQRTHAVTLGGMMSSGKVMDPQFPRQKHRGFGNLTADEGIQTGSSGLLDPALGRSKLLRALSICQIYGYFDYALELIDLIGHTLFSREETKQLILHMQSQASIKTWIPNFPGRTKLYWKLMKIAKRIQPRSHKLKERYLGNR